MAQAPARPAMRDGGAVVGQGAVSAIARVSGPV